MFSFKKLSFAKKLLVFAGLLCLVNFIGIGLLIAHGMSSGMLDEIIEDYGFLFRDTEYLGWEEEKKKTIKDTTEAIKKNPKNAKAYAKRAKAYYWLDQYKKALADYNKAISLNGGNDEWYSFRAYVRRYTDDEEGALSDYAKAIKLNSKESEYYKDRGDLYEELGQNQKALEDYKLAIDHSKKPASALIKRAELLTSLGRYAEAKKDLGTAIEKADNYEKTSAIRERVDIHLKTKDYQNAVKDCGLWIEASPDSSYAYEKRAEIYKLMNETEKADHDWSCAIKIVTEEIKGDDDGGDAYDYKTRSEYYTELGKTKLAQADYKKAIVGYLEKDKFKTYDFDTAVELNQKLEDKDFGKKAFFDYAQRLTTSIKYDDKNPKLYYLLGNTYEQLGKASQAKSNWKNSLAVLSKSQIKLKDSTLEDIYKKLDDQKGLNKLLEKSISELKRKIALNPKSDGFYHSLGIDYQKLEKYDLAEDAFTRAIELKPKNDHYLWHRAETKITRADYASAIEDLDSALSLDESDSSAYASYAKALVKLGKNQQAIEKANRAISLDKESGKAYYWRFKARLALGQSKLAKVDQSKSKELNFNQEKEKSH